MIVLFTGLPSAGKTTLARGCRGRLDAAGRRAVVLDGDELRARFWPELGLDRADRREHLMRTADLAAMFCEAGVIALIAAIAPYAEDRAAVRGACVTTGLSYLEIHVSTPVAICAARDDKGLYSAWRRGEIEDLTGVDARYDVPVDPELRVNTAGETVEASVEVVTNFITTRLRSAPPG